MQTSSIPDALPLDVLYEVLGHLVRLADLVRCSHVCRRWRDVATHQYPYAQDVSWLFGQTEAENNFLLHRLAASTLPLDFMLLLHDNDGRLDVPDAILSALSDNIYRLRSLKVYCDESVVPAILRALSHPAPILRELFMSIEPDASIPEQRHLHIPPGYELFAGHAPRLEMVQFCELGPPVVRVPAFNAVKSVSLEFTVSYPWMKPEFLLVTFPNAKRVDLNCNDFVDLSRLGSSPLYPAVFEAVDVVGTHNPVALLSPLVSPRTPCIRTEGDNILAPGVIGLLMSHIPSDVLTCEISFYLSTSTCVEISFFHPDSGFQRGFVFSDMRQAFDNCDEFNACLCHLRITEIKVEAILFSRTSNLFPFLPALRVLTILNGLPIRNGLPCVSAPCTGPCFDDSDEDDPSSELDIASPPRIITRIRCPALVKLVLAQRGGGGQAIGVDVEDLVRFMDQALGEIPSKALELELQNISLNTGRSATPLFSRVVVRPYL